MSGIACSMSAALELGASHSSSYESLATRKASPGIRFNEHMEGDGPTVFAHACKMGLKGIASKRKGSAYRSGRSPNWLKMKYPAAPGGEPGSGGGLGADLPRKIKHFSSINSARGKALRLFER